MARYRKCPRPCAQGNSCKWIHKMLQQVPPLKCPYFLKNVSSFMLWRPTNPFPRLEVPAEFVHQHGDKFNGTLVEVKGPCQKTWSMRVKILMLEHTRVMWDVGWRHLVTDLGLNKGDHLLFVLTSFSKFKVYIFDDVGMRRRPFSTQEPHKACEIGNTTTSVKRPLNPSFIRSSHENEHPREDSPAFHKISEQSGGKLHSVREDTIRVGSEPCKRKLRGSLAAEPVVIELSDDKSKDPSESANTCKEREIESEEFDSFQCSEGSDQSMPSKYPRFTKQVPVVSLRHQSGQNCTHLEVPATFVQRHEDLFKQEKINLEGPTGRIWPVMCQTSTQQQYKRVKLRSGWFDFAKDNMLKLKDQLMFTHKAEGHFLVQIVPKGRRSERPHQAREHNSPDISEEKEEGGHAQTLPDDQIDISNEPTTPFQRPDNNKDLLRSKIQQLQQQLQARRKPPHKQAEDRYIGRRGRMEWGLGHS